jgi:hypothetical protein
MQYDTVVSCACCCADALLVSACPTARVDSAGKPACEECGRRLTNCKGKLHRRDPGYICQRCFNYTWRTPTSDVDPSPTATVKQSRKRRAASDPGESPEPAASQAFAHRVVAPEAATTSKKQYNTRQKEQIMRLLEETHARRMAAEKATAAAAAATGGRRGAAHTGFTLAFVP